MNLAEKECTCRNERDMWTRQGKYPHEHFVCQTCSAVHICDHKCSYVVMHREAWVCRISGCVRHDLQGIQNGNTFIDPALKTSKTTRVVSNITFSGTSEDISLVNRSELIHERLKTNVVLVLDKLIFKKPNVNISAQVRSKGASPLTNPVLGNAQYSLHVACLICLLLLGL